MHNFHEFHDGWFDGLRIDESHVQVYLRTASKVKFIAAAKNVLALSAGGLKQGNIVFEVVTRDHNEITLEDIVELYDLQRSDPLPQAIKLLEQTRSQTPMVLEVNPSYGGSCLILASSVELIKSE
jgi:hypothetical protein